MFKITRNFIYGSKDNIILVLNKLGKIVFSYKNQEILDSNFKYQTAFTDKQNILWISTRNGIVKLVTKKNPFNIYQENQSIRGIYKNKNNLFIGSYTENALIDLINNKKAKIPGAIGAFSSSYQDKNSHIWFGSTTNRVYEYFLNEKKWRFHSIDERINLFVTFKNLNTGKLWVGTSDGLVWLDTETNKISYHKSSLIKSSTEIRAFYKHGNDIWIVSNKGLYLMDAITESITNHYNVESGLPFDNFNHLYIDSEGMFWLATKGGGLIQWDKTNNTYSSFTTKNGFSNNTIYAVYPDNFNNLWLPSNNGLIRFNKKTKNTRVYLAKDGIAHEEFNTFAHGSRFGGHSLFIKNKKLYYVYNFLGIKPEQVFVSNTTLKPGKYTLGMEFVRESAGEYGESLGNTKLYINETVVAEGPMRTQPAKFTLSGDGLCVGYDSGDNVSNLYKSPGEFEGGIIQGVGVTVEGTPYRDLEAEAKRLMMTQ